MNIFFAPAVDFKRQLFGIVGIVLFFGLTLTFTMRRREGKWEHTGLVVDFVKVIFYGLLAYLTLYLQFDENTKKFSLSLIDRKLSLGEMLVVLLAVLEVVSNIVSIFIRFENISKSNSNHIKEIFDEFDRESEKQKRREQFEIEREKRQELEKKHYRERQIAIRNERLNRIKKKKFKYYE